MWSGTWYFIRTGWTGAPGMNAPGLKCIKAFLIGSGVNICPKKSETAWVEGEVVEKKNFWTKKEISPQPNSHEILLYRELLAGPMDYNHFNTEHGGWKLTSCTLTCWNMYPRARGQTGAREEVKGPGEETSLIIREDYSDHYHHKSAK